MFSGEEQEEPGEEERGGDGTAPAWSPARGHTEDIQLCAQVTPLSVLMPVLWNRKDFFRIRIRLFWQFRIRSRIRILCDFKNNLTKVWIKKKILQKIVIQVYIIHLLCMVETGTAPAIFLVLRASSALYDRQTEYTE